ncbi:MFS transporter [Chloroflexota bacterium]
MTGEKKSKIFYGYIVVGASFVIMMFALGANRSFGVFLEPMLAEFGWSRAGISGAFTVSLMLAGFLGIVAGRMTDRYGPRVVLITSGIFLGLGYILIARVGAIWHFYLFYGIIVGIGFSGSYSPLVSLIARWFVKRRGLMSGITVAGPALGITIVPILSSLLISASGWRISYIVIGGVVTVVIVSAALFLRRDPAEMGLKPYGAGETVAGGVDLQTTGLSFTEAICTRQFWMFNTMSFCDMFVKNIIIVHVVIHAIETGITATAAASVISVASGISMGGKIVMGAIADRVGNRRALLFCFSMGLVAFLLLLFAKQLWMFYLFSVFFGLGNWVSRPVMPPLAAELFGLKAHGTLFACINLSTLVGGAIGPLVAGRIFDSTGSYTLTFLVCISALIIALIAVVFLRPVAKTRETMG